MRYLLLILAAAQLIGCDHGKLPFVSREELSTCENKLSELQEKLKGFDDREGQKDSLASCLAHAQAMYQSYIELNAHKVRNDPRGAIWQAPPRIWGHAEVTKRNAIEECRVLYK